MSAPFRRIALAASLLAFLAGPVSAASGVVEQAQSAVRQASDWLRTDGPVLQRAAFIAAGGPVRPDREDS